ncbi:MAG: signal peptidase II, partial [Prochlorococcaceae cyanobacterium ETNP7_MAG_30]|nr:signal peptidase II [Prochlorococcaceae cyanobacterium ETNP7_MAG_30]
MNQRQIKPRSILLISILLMLIDQISKNWARQKLSSGLSLPCVPGLLRFRLVSHTGAAFSLF